MKKNKKWIVVLICFGFCIAALIFLGRGNFLRLLHNRRGAMRFNGMQILHKPGTMFIGLQEDMTIWDRTFGVTEIHQKPGRRVLWVFSEDKAKRYDIDLTSDVTFSPRLSTLLANYENVFLYVPRNVVKRESWLAWDGKEFVKKKHKDVISEYQALLSKYARSNVYESNIKGGLGDWKRESIPDERSNVSFSWGLSRVKIIFEYLNQVLRVLCRYGGEESELMVVDYTRREVD